METSRIQSKTCQSCADSKVRCVRNGDDVCNRCNRLGRQCVDRKARRRFHGFQKDLKIKALESQIDKLTRSRNGSADLESLDEVDRHSTEEEDVISRGILSMDTAISLLDTFKEKMTPHFPFVVIPPETSAESLRREKRFLFLAILASASFADMPLQRRLGMEMKTAVASRMIVNGEMSFELLQGLLIYLAWNHYHTRPSRYTQFLQLAISIVIEYRLDRPPLTKTWKTPLKFKVEDEDTEDETCNRPSWGLDEKRAIAGCYYLSSTVAVLVQKQFHFSYTPYIEDCCKTVSDSAIGPYDKYLFYIIQLQHSVDKIDQLSARHASELGTPGSGAELYVTSLIADLEAFQTRLPFAISDLPLLAMQFHSAELSLYQLSLSGLKSRASAHAIPNHLLKDELLSKALMAANSLLNIYLALPLGSEAAFNNTQWMQLGFATLVASRLLVAVPSSKSDLRAAEIAQRRVLWTNILEQCKARIDTLCTEQVDSNGDRDVFHNFRQRLVRIQKLVNRASENVGSLSNPQSRVEETSADAGFGNYFSIPQDGLFDSMVDPMLGDWANDSGFSW